MGEVISMREYIERKAMERDPEAVKHRLAEIAIELLVLQSEETRLKSVLPQEKM